MNCITIPNQHLDKIIGAKDQVVMTIELKRSELEILVKETLEDTDVEATPLRIELVTNNLIREAVSTSRHKESLRDWINVSLGYSLDDIIKESYIF
jgi:hypothetical protein